MDKFCKQFITNPTIDPRNNKPISKEAYNNFVNTCERKGFNVSQLKYEQPFEVLSDEVIYRIFQDLDAEEVFELCMTDKKFKNICDERFWKSMYRKHFPDFLLEDAYQDTWFNYFRLALDMEKFAKFLDKTTDYLHDPVDVYDVKFLMIKSDYLPEEIYTATQLDHLTVTGGLKSLPANFSNLKSLEDLNLSDNDFTQIPAEIFNLESLKYLYLSNNQISQIPEKIANLQLLENLWLDGNQITKVPEAIGLLDNLVALNLSNNLLNIYSLPKSLWNLSNLRELNLSDNKFISIPEDIGNLRNLQVLVLSNNALKSLPKNLNKLKSLLELTVDHNRLDYIDEDVLNLPEINYISATHNPFKIIPQATKPDLELFV